MTPAEVDTALARRGPRRIGEIADLCLARLWYRVIAYRTAHRLALPPEHLRPRLADPQPDADYPA